MPKKKNDIINYVVREGSTIPAASQPKHQVLCTIREVADVTDFSQEELEKCSWGSPALSAMEVSYHPYVQDGDELHRIQADDHEGVLEALDSCSTAAALDAACMFVWRAEKNPEVLIARTVAAVSYLMDNLTLKLGLPALSPVELRAVASRCVGAIKGSGPPAVSFTEDELRNLTRKQVPN